MPGNRKLQRNGFVANSSANDNVEEIMRRFKIESKDDNNGGAYVESGSYPERPGQPDCIYYLRTGTCGYGTKCRFNHPSNAGQVNSAELPQRFGQPDCGYYLRTGTCKHGSSCENHHPKDRQAHNPKAESSVLLNVLGLPMRQDGKPCPYYMRTGSCKYGYTCKFHHPQPTSAGSVLPVVGPTYGSGGSSAGAPSVGEYSASSSVLQFPQSCMPVMLPGSQSWNAYARSFSPLSITSILGASYLPERPDQPECRYYMNHGSCKYGSDCKYHHPRDKTVQLASGSIGPLGLPLRPGQSVCLYYSLYGLCKYGPTCKYDHPLDGYIYAYGMSNVAPMATCYSSSSPYQSISSTSSPSRSSKSGDWVKKGVTIRDKNNQHLVGKSTNENSSDVVSDILPHLSKASSDVTHNESD
ncbi:hypothetical protein CASFOL_019927 [Castilleja foliolosa]|uniref:C3H1-type domain-containing protein n=1 Tax=Castilleja foliolosa TaxID=1961234 RepID=A0ABD3D350_9LAMI